MERLQAPLSILPLNATATTAALLLPTLFLTFVAYGFHKLHTRVAPGIPYAGGDSLSARLQVPVEYGKDPVAFLTKTRKALGDVFCVDLLVTKIVFVLGAEGNREIFKASEDDLSFWEQIRWAMGPKLSVTIDYPGWISSSYKTMKTAILRQDRLEAYCNDCRGLAGEYFDGWSQKDAIPLFSSVSHLVLAHLLVILMGEPFYRKHGAEIIPMMSQYERDLQHPLLRVLPWALWGTCGAGARVFRANDRISALVDAELDALLAEPEKHAGRTDYFHFLVSALGARFRACYGTHIASMVFGGHANAAMSIPWLFLHARRTPGALARARAEVLADDASTLETERPFLEACLRETARLYTNTAVMRMTKKPGTRVAGHVLPAGVLVACSPTAAQRDASVFADADRWRPERFLAADEGGDEEKPGEDKGVGPYAEWFRRAQFVHFGLGVHACPGEKMARVIIFDCILRTWLQDFDVEVVRGLREGEVGIDGVGAEGSWAEENFGTPSVRGGDVYVRVRRRGGEA